MNLWLCSYDWYFLTLFALWPLSEKYIYSIYVCPVLAVLEAAKVAEGTLDEWLLRSPQQFPGGAAKDSREREGVSGQSQSWIQKHGTGTRLTLNKSFWIFLVTLLLTGSLNCFTKMAYIQVIKADFDKRFFLSVYREMEVTWVTS